MKYIFSVILSLAAASCSSAYLVNDTVKPFETGKYMGRWYEIERLPNKYEDGLEECTSLFTLMDDGSFIVVNEGRLISDRTRIKQWKGKGMVPDKTYPSKMKISFNWPFSEDYWVFKIDGDYTMALVGSPSGDALWIIARDKDLDPRVILDFKNYAAKLGFPVKLMFRSLAY